MRARDFVTEVGRRLAYCFLRRDTETRVLNAGIRMSLFGLSVIFAVPKIRVENEAETVLHPA